MFPRRPGMEERPMRPSPFALPRRQQPQQVSRPGILSQFQSPDGNLDFEKISATAKQVNDIYQQVSPMVRPMITKFLNR